MFFRVSAITRLDLMFRQINMDSQRLQCSSVVVVPRVSRGERGVSLMSLPESGMSPGADLVATEEEAEAMMSLVSRIRESSAISGGVVVVGVSELEEGTKTGCCVEGGCPGDVEDKGTIVVVVSFVIVAGRSGSVVILIPSSLTSTASEAEYVMSSPSLIGISSFFLGCGINGTDVVVVSRDNGVIVVGGRTTSCLCCSFCSNCCLLSPS